MPDASHLNTGRCEQVVHGAPVLHLKGQLLESFLRLVRLHRDVQLHALEVTPYTWDTKHSVAIEDPFGCEGQGTVLESHRLCDQGYYDCEATSEGGQGGFQRAGSRSLTTGCRWLVGAELHLPPRRVFGLDAIR